LGKLDNLASSSVGKVTLGDDTRLRIESVCASLFDPTKRKVSMSFKIGTLLLATNYDRYSILVRLTEDDLIKACRNVRDRCGC